MSAAQWKGAQRHYAEQEWTLDALEPAWAKASLYFRSGCSERFGHGDEEERCRSLPAIAATMKGIRERFEEGRDIELLHAIALAAEENLPLPTWAALAFVARFAAYTSVTGDCPPSLDAALLGKSAPATAEKLALDRRDWVLGHRIWRHVREHAIGHTGLVPAVRSAIAALDPGVSSTKARELVLRVEAVYQAKSPGHLPLNSQFRPIRRKRSK